LLESMSVEQFFTAKKRKIPLWVACFNLTRPVQTIDRMTTEDLLRF
jgi:hypothetical protein